MNSQEFKMDDKGGFKLRKDTQNDVIFTVSDHKSQSKDVITALHIEEENIGMESDGKIKELINDSDGSRGLLKA